MTLAQWQALGIVCGSILAAAGVAGLLWRKVVRPMLRGLKRLGQMADLFLGDREKAIPSMPERMTTLESTVAEHLRSHPVLHVNGTPAARRRR